MRWLNFTALTVPVIHTLIFTGTNIKPMDFQFTCSVNSRLDQAAVKKNLRKAFMQISTNPQAQFFCQSGMLCLTLLFTTVLCSPLKHINILTKTKSSETYSFNMSMFSLLLQNETLQQWVEFIHTDESVRQSQTVV